MKKLADSMSVTRWLLLGALVFSLGLGLNGLRLRQHRVGLQRALKSQVPELARELQVHARRYSRLWEEADGAGLTGQKDPQTYLAELAADENVLLGAVDFVRQAPNTLANGVVDDRYLIRPQSRDRGFLRVNLANFMHLIEQRSRRMRVTHVRLDREGNPRPHEFGNDRWKWEIEVTSRQKEGSR